MRRYVILFFYFYEHNALMKPYQQCLSFFLSSFLFFFFFYFHIRQKCNCLCMDVEVQEKSNDSNLATPNHAMPQYKRTTQSPATLRRTATLPWRDTLPCAIDVRVCFIATFLHTSRQSCNPVFLFVGTTSQNQQFTSTVWIVVQFTWCYGIFLFVQMLFVNFYTTPCTV